MHCKEVPAALTTHCINAQYSTFYASSPPQELDRTLCTKQSAHSAPLEDSPGSRSTPALRRTKGKKSTRVFLDLAELDAWSMASLHIGLPPGGGVQLLVGALHPSANRHSGWLWSAAQFVSGQVKQICFSQFVFLLHVATR